MVETTRLASAAPAAQGCCRTAVVCVLRILYLMVCAPFIVVYLLILSVGSIFLSIVASPVVACMRLVCRGSTDDACKDEFAIWEIIMELGRFGPASRLLPLPPCLQAPPQPPQPYEDRAPV